MKISIPVVLMATLPLLSHADVKSTTNEPADKSNPSRKPNIIVIVSDDQGYADAGFQGNPHIPTPNLDKLAQGGVRCTNGYVTAPVSSPSRAGLMTGRYQQRFGHHNNIVADAAKPIAHLPGTEVTLADAMNSAGYHTALIGKWHLGLQDGFRPYERGFKEFFGIITGGHDYWENNPDKRARGDGDYKARIERNGVGEKVEGYLTAVFGREASRVVRENKDRPFFLYLAFNAPHTPTQAPDDLEKTISDTIKGKKRRAYIAQIASMDAAIGSVMKALAETGTDENTFIVFFSDNGGAKISYYDNAPLRETKGTLYEGGIRVPFLASYPGHIPAGSVCDVPVTSLDVFATACSLAGTKSAENLDSRDMLPVLKGKMKKPVHDVLYWDFPAFGRALRKDNLKLVVKKGGEPQLYDLKEDISESRDLASKRPDETKQLLKLLNDWSATTVKPLWGPDSIGAAKK